MDEHVCSGSEWGAGGAVAVLSAQVDDLTRTFAAAQATAAQSADTLTGLTSRAEAMSQRLELQMASLHDIPAPQSRPQAQPAPSQQSAPEPMFIRHRTTEVHQ